MLIYNAASAKITETGEVYGWLTFKYDPKNQPETDVVILERLYVNPTEYRVRQNSFVLDPKYNSDNHNQICHNQFFTTTEKLVEFIREGLRTEVENYYKHKTELIKNLHPRKVCANNE